MMLIRRPANMLLLPILLSLITLPAAADIWGEAQFGFADSGGVNIHYATVGEGPLVVMIHGFPDFWYSWRHQMAGLQDDFQVVAIDQRGYNYSDKPAGTENYDMQLLTADVEAVIRHLGHDSATIVGHDWGGMVAWYFAFSRPQMVDQLVILNLPHPHGLARELAVNPAQRDNSGYAFRFQQGSPSDPDVFFGMPMTAQTMAGWVQDPAARQRYVQAFQNSDFDAMLAYYKRNFPPLPPLQESAPPLSPDIPQLNVPLLVFHGLDDTALLSDGLNNTWDWNDDETTIVAIPGAGHFVQQDAAGRVTDTLRRWLLAQQ